MTDSVPIQYYPREGAFSASEWVVGSSARYGHALFVTTNREGGYSVYSAMMPYTPNENLGTVETKPETWADLDQIVWSES